MGTQTRLLRFSAPAAVGEPTWQGQSVAEWEVAPGREPGLVISRSSLRTCVPDTCMEERRAVQCEGGRDRAFADLNTMPNGDQWMTVTTKVEDLCICHALPHHDRLQEAARRGGVEPVALPGALNQLSRNQESQP